MSSQIVIGDLEDIKKDTKEDIKKEIISILVPIFGERIKKDIMEYYDNNNPSELFSLAHYMLSGYMGESNADKLLQNFTKKFPKMREDG